MPKVKSRQPHAYEGNALSTYDGTTGEAHFAAMGRMYGPVKVSIPDHHTIAAALEMARKEGGIRAAREIKAQIDTTVTNVFSRY